MKFYVRFFTLASRLNLYSALNLTILHTNDVHARIAQFNAFGSDCRPQDADAGACFGGEARRLTKVKEIRSQRPNVLLLGAGDRFVGTLWFTQFKGIADSTLMNRFPYDAMVCFSKQASKFIMKSAKYNAFGCTIQYKEQHNNDVQKQILRQYNVVYIGVIKR